MLLLVAEDRQAWRSRVFRDSRFGKEGTKSFCIL